ncbi:hypothetical protein Prudu_016641, partial [Prunus dulcis]
LQAISRTKERNSRMRQCLVQLPISGIQEVVFKLRKREDLNSYRRDSVQAIYQQRKITFITVQHEEKAHNFCILAGAKGDPITVSIRMLNNDGLQMLRVSHHPKDKEVESLRKKFAGIQADRKEREEAEAVKVAAQLKKTEVSAYLFSSSLSPKILEGSVEVYMH